MGGSSSRQDVNETVERIAANPVLAQLLPREKAPASPIVSDADTIQTIRGLDWSRIRKEDLALEILRMTEIYEQRVANYQGNPLYQISSLMAHAAGTNIQSSLSTLQLVGAQLGVERHVVRDANLQNERSYKKLARSVGKAVLTAVSAFASRIRFTNVIRAYTMARFGAKPYFIKMLAHHSGLGVIGIPAGAMCLGLTAHSLYFHPEILSLLEKFNNPANVEYFLNNMDVTVAAMAIWQVFRNELAFILQESYKFEALRADLQLLSPAGYVVKSAVSGVVSLVHTYGWAHELMTRMSQTGTADIMRTFAFWLQNKTFMFSSIVEVVADITGMSYVKQKAQEAASTVYRAASKMAKMSAAEAVSYVKSGVESVVKNKLSWVMSWWEGESQQVLEHAKEAAKSTDYVPEEEKEIYLPGDKETPIQTALPK